MMQLVTGSCDACTLGCARVHKFESRYLCRDCWRAALEAWALVHERRQVAHPFGLRRYEPVELEPEAA